MTFVQILGTALCTLMYNLSDCLQIMDFLHKNSTRTRRRNAIIVITREYFLNYWIENYVIPLNADAFQWPAITLIIAIPVWMIVRLEYAHVTRSSDRAESSFVSLKMPATLSASLGRSRNLFLPAADAFGSRHFELLFWQYDALSIAERRRDGHSRILPSDCYRLRKARIFRKWTYRNPKFYVFADCLRERLVLFSERLFSLMPSWGAIGQRRASTANG